MFRTRRRLAPLFEYFIFATIFFLPVMDFPTPVCFVVRGRRHWLRGRTRKEAFAYPTQADMLRTQEVELFRWLATHGRRVALGRFRKIPTIRSARSYAIAASIIASHSSPEVLEFVYHITLASMKKSSLMRAYLLVKIIPVPVKQLCDLC